ncbi:MAG TPA: DUF5011 domain-containing protein [Candidatus Faecimorpha stercoravium]|nr:DUF5011 domain-containing protein [Candidatus Faecimorpha stercoravium]
MKKWWIIMSGIGILCCAALFLLWLYAGWQEENTGTVYSVASAAEIQLDSEVLEYDGSGTLNLMEGVQAVGPEGEDLTERVQAILTGDGTLLEKQIRYSVFTEEGRETTVTRTLKMVGYTGPKLSVEDGLVLEVEDLPDLIQILTEQGDLTADNGFGQNAADEVSYTREKRGEGYYEVEFKLQNEYLDETSQTVEMWITGEVQDIELTLSQSSIQIAAGTEFYPQEWIETAHDPVHGDMTSQVQIENRVNLSQAGQYSVIYTLYSYDHTQKAEAVLRVEVVG